MKIALLTALITSLLFGHKLYILADDDGKNLHVKSYFTKSSPCMNCEVKIYKDNQLLDTTQTDENGNAIFKLKTKKIDIEVTASMGHQNKINYSSENEIITEENNITIKKILMGLGSIILIFFILRIFKK